MHLLQVVAEFGVVLGIMVLVHEFGHFALAKLCGVRVEAFALGFGTRLFGVRYHGTDYRVNLLPLGGYVKMAGETVGNEPTSSTTQVANDPGDFNAHPRWQRVLIALAGPVANFILAFFLLAVVAHNHHEIEQYLTGPAVLDYVPSNSPATRIGLRAGDTIRSFAGHANPTWLTIEEESALHMGATLPLTVEHNGATLARTLAIDTGDTSGEFSAGSMEHIGLLPRQQTQPITVQAIEPGTPAAEAGLQPGDRIERIDALAPHSVGTLLAYLQDRNGAPSTLQIERAGRQLRVPIVPKKLASGTGEVYRLGFRPVPTPVDVVKLPLGQAMKQAAQESIESSTLILRVLKGMFTRQVAMKSVSGPVGMAQMIDTAAHDGYWTLLQLMSAISINLGILNLMPFPVLDGGMILFLAIEALMRRDVNQQIKERVYQVAFVCLIVFMAVVMFNDITKLHLRP